MPLTRGGIQPADARGFAGIAFTARGDGGYRMILDGYGIDQRNWPRATFAAGATATEVRLPFAAFVGADPDIPVDPAALRAIVIRLEGTPGSRAWLQVANLRFYR